MCAISKNGRIKEYYSFIISKPVKEIFYQYRQVKNTSLEACGVLIGNHKMNGNIIYVKYATIPHEKDIRRRYSFKLDSASHQNILEKYFKLSENEDVYLGTWHTHPENIPIPSNDDIIDWKKQYNSNKNLFKRMIFTIVGIRKVRYWMIDKNNLVELSGREIIHEKDA
jgi:integrative and conjugative element protein (TIGR02256 family)